MKLAQLIKKKETALLIAAVLVGLAVRLPGIWWGSNFPDGWYGHHPDEYTHVLHAQLLINRNQPHYGEGDINKIGVSNPWAAGYSVTPYPKGLAVHVAVPIIVSRILSHARGTPPPPSAEIIPLGRTITALYGTATIIVIYFLAKCLFTGAAVPVLSAWILALCGLHVTQSHFFVADIPAIFWFLLGIIFLWHDQNSTTRSNSSSLAAAALFFGIAFGMKLFLASIPSLAIAALIRPGRFWRVVLIIAFFQFGVFIVNAGLYTPLNFYQTVFRGISDTHTFSRAANAILYFAQLPGIISFPLFLASMAGGFLLLREILRIRDRALLIRVTIVIILPLLLHLLLVIFRLDHFPRHLILFIPWLVLCGAWALSKLTNRLAQKSRRLANAIPITFLIYQAVFVYDGEKGFINDPRNLAAEWIYANIETDSTMWWYYHSLKDYQRVDFPAVRPDIIVEEMHHANHYLSGIGMRDSLPESYLNIFDGRSQDYVDAFQGLFMNNTEYSEAARFSEHYFMPEYTLTDRLLGNRSRNYLAEVVIFTKTR